MERSFALVGKLLEGWARADRGEDVQRHLSETVTMTVILRSSVSLWLQNEAGLLGISSTKLPFKQPLCSILYSEW